VKSTRAGQSGRRPGSIEPTGLWRLLFWLIFLLGSLSFIVSFLLGQIPHVPGDDLRLDYAVSACTVSLMLTSILMARWLWGIKSFVPEPSYAIWMWLVLLIAWAESAVALITIISLAIYRR